MHQTIRAESATVRTDFSAAIGNLAAVLAEFKVEVRTLSAEMRGEMKALAARMDGLEGHMRGEFNGIKHSIATMKWAVSAFIAVLGLGQGLLLWKLSVPSPTLAPMIAPALPAAAAPPVASAASHPSS